MDLTKVLAEFISSDREDLPQTADEVKENTDENDFAMFNNDLKSRKKRKRYSNYFNNLCPQTDDKQ